MVPSNVELMPCILLSLGLSNTYLSLSQLGTKAVEKKGFFPVVLFFFTFCSKIEYPVRLSECPKGDKLLQAPNFSHQHK